MQKISRRAWTAHRSPTAHRSLVGSLIESLLESIGASRRRGSWLRGIGLVLAAGTLGLAAPAGATLPIDDFSSNQDLVLMNGEASVSGFAPAPAAIGGERDLQIERVSGFGGANINVNGGVPPQGELQFISGSGVQAVVRMVWDGEDSDADQINFVGLGGVDLSAGGMLDAFAIELGFDQETTLSLRVYDASDATGDTWSGATVPVFRTMTPFEVVEIPFAEFTQCGMACAADFTNVGAVSLEVGSADALDFRLTNVQVVPEPVGASLAGLAALALLAHRRRRGER